MDTGSGTLEADGALLLLLAFDEDGAKLLPAAGGTVLEL